MYIVKNVTNRVIYINNQPLNPLEEITVNELNHSDRCRILKKEAVTLEISKQQNIYRNKVQDDYKKELENKLLVDRKKTEDIIKKKTKISNTRTNTPKKTKIKTNSNRKSTEMKKEKIPISLDSIFSNEK